MDLELIETNNGGDLVQTPKDLSVIFGFENMIYLALFGGNVEASTSKKLNGEFDSSWWGNFFLEDTSLQFNSETERLLNNTAMTSSARITLENTIKSDLKFMNELARIKVMVVMPGLDRIVIGIQAIRDAGLQKQEFIYLWDVTNKELTSRQNPPMSSGGGSGIRFFEEYFESFFE